MENKSTAMCKQLLLRAKCNELNPVPMGFFSFLSFRAFLHFGVHKHSVLFVNGVFNTDVLINQNS